MHKSAVGAVVPLQTHGRYNCSTVIVRDPRAVVPLQTHGRYNMKPRNCWVAGAVVPLQTHGRYNTGETARTV